jgi:threonine/homoserine/homoserine lactone efflux protein
MLATLAKAIALGFAVAAPVGPISVLCMQRTLTIGRAAGLATGLGIALADAVYAGLAASGVGFAADFLVAQARWLLLAAGVFLVVLGLKILKTEPDTKGGEVSDGALGRDVLTAFALTMANPMTILALVAAFAALGLAEAGDTLRSGALLVAGVFAGSMAWWIALVAGVSVIHHQISPAAIHWINRAAGLVLAGFGAFAFGRGLVTG